MLGTRAPALGCSEQHGVGEGDVEEHGVCGTSENANLAEAEKRLASLKASQAASKSTCGQVASDYEFSVIQKSQRMIEIPQVQHVDKVVWRF